MSRRKGNFEAVPMRAMSLSELETALDSLATFSERSVYVADETETGQILGTQKLDTYKCIWNNKLNAPATIASQGYITIQHKEVLGALVSVLKETMPDAKLKASINEYQGKAEVKAVFEKFTAEDGAEGVECGISMLNSGDRTTSLKVSGSEAGFKSTFEFCALRLVCLNGMTVRVSGAEIDFNKAIVPKEGARVGDYVGSGLHETRELLNTQEVRTDIRHYGQKAKLEVKAISNCLLQLPSVVSGLETQIKTAQGLGISGLDAENWLKTLGFCPRTTEKLLEGFKTEEATAWGLYNAGTRYFSHEPMSMLAQNRGLRQIAPVLGGMRF